MAERGMPPEQLENAKNMAHKFAPVGVYCDADLHRVVRHARRLAGDGDWLDAGSAG